MKDVPRVLDARIIFHKILKRGYTRFENMYKYLFGKKLIVNLNNCSWEQRPLTMNQLTMAASDLQNLVQITTRIVDMAHVPAKDGYFYNKKVRIEQLVSFI